MNYLFAKKLSIIYHTKILQLYKLAGFLMRAITKSLLALFFLVTFTTACSKGPLSPFKRDVRQGNYITQAMVDKLKPNLTKSQVQNIMGSPTLISVFRQNIWDYDYLLIPGDGSKTQHRALSLYFKGGKLIYYKGDWSIKGLPKKS